MPESSSESPSGAETLDPPIHVDWIDQELLGDERPGRLGVTILPGKRGNSVRYPGLVYRRDTRTDLDRLRSLGMRLLVLLVEDRELERWGDPAFEAHAREAGVGVRRLPIRDGAAPPSAAAVDELLGEIDAERAQGDVVIACMGGVGRSGTIAACALVAAGLSPDGAIAHLRDVRHPTAVETARQVEFVAAYAAHREAM
jgi:protein-tyrosine phosphatase